MSFLAGSNTLERLNQAVALSFGCTFTCAQNVPPTFTIQAPASPADVGFVFNTAAGTLLTGVTFAGVNTTANWGANINNPTFGLEIVDGNVAANGLVILGLGVVNSATNATTNIGSGTPFNWDRATNDGYVSANNGIALNIRAALVTAGAVTNLLTSMNGATSNVIKCSFRVVYVPRQ